MNNPQFAQESNRLASKAQMACVKREQALSNGLWVATQGLSALRTMRFMSCKDTRVSGATLWRGSGLTA
jgi:hypothetical protein